MKKTPMIISVRPFQFDHHEKGKEEEDIIGRLKLSFIHPSTHPHPRQCS